MGNDIVQSIQDMVNDYLKKHGKITITEMYANNNKKEPKGVLTPLHNIVLQQMIRAYLKENGIDIDDEMKNGKQIVGALSNTEIKYLRYLLDNYQFSDKSSKKIA